MKNTYKIDFVNNTLTMSKAFEEALNNPNSEEYKLFLQLPRPVHYPQDPPRPQEGPPHKKPDLQAHGAVHERVSERRQAAGPVRGG